MPEYTFLTALGIVAVVVLEFSWARTGIFKTLRYWVSMVIVFGFQVAVDGWLTKLSAPIVLYDRNMHSGIRWPWDIPIEDFGFGFALVTLVIILWQRRADNESE